MIRYCCELLWNIFTI